MKLQVLKTGDFRKFKGFLAKPRNAKNRAILERYGRIGVKALEEATPMDSGLTAACWGYEIIEGPNGYELVWTNSNVVDGWANIAILIQYGHATGTGGYVEGVDYINPALKSVFEGIAANIWDEVRQ